MSEVGAFALGLGFGNRVVDGCNCGSNDGAGGGGGGGSGVGSLLCFRLSVSG